MVPVNDFYHFIKRGRSVRTVAFFRFGGILHLHFIDNLQRGNIFRFKKFIHHFIVFFGGPAAFMVFNNFIFDAFVPGCFLKIDRIKVDPQLLGGFFQHFARGFKYFRKALPKLFIGYITRFRIG